MHVRKFNFPNCMDIFRPLRKMGRTRGECVEERPKLPIFNDRDVHADCFRHKALALMELRVLASPTEIFSDSRSELARPRHVG